MSNKKQSEPEESELGTMSKNSAIFKEVLTTERVYDVVTNRDGPQYLPDDLKCCDIRSRMQAEIEVPSWRLHPLSSCYSLEGTENLDDDVFLRRHSKLESDERRRKRWDIQRLREQKHNERLRTGRYYSPSVFEKTTDTKKSTKPEITSFYPEAKEAHLIEVCDKLPLIAFGHPIPKLPEKPFTLPWAVAYEPSKVTTSSKSRASPVKK
jgi:male-specific lethal 1